MLRVRLLERMGSAGAAQPMGLAVKTSIAKPVEELQNLDRALAAFEQVGKTTGLLA